MMMMMMMMMATTTTMACELYTDDEYWCVVMYVPCVEQADDGYRRGKYSIEIFLTEYVASVLLSVIDCSLW